MLPQRWKGQVTNTASTSLKTKNKAETRTLPDSKTRYAATGIRTAW